MPTFENIRVRLSLLTPFGIKRNGVPLYIAGLLLLAACTPPADKQRPAEQGLVAKREQAIQYADTCRAFIARLQAAYEKAAPTNEFEALKIRNNRDMIESNIEHLEELLAQAAGDTPDSALSTSLRAQVEYLRALIASGEAILSEDSQSFGKWQEDVTPPNDSVMTPVKRLN